MGENIANRISNKDLKNIVKNVAQGKTLTPLERARLKTIIKKKNLQRFLPIL